MFRQEAVTLGWIVPVIARAAFVETFANKTAVPAFEATDVVKGHNIVDVVPFVTFSRAAIGAGTMGAGTACFGRPCSIFSS